MVSEFMGYFVCTFLLHTPQPLGGPLANRNLVHEVGSYWAVAESDPPHSQQTNCDRYIVEINSIHYHPEQRFTGFNYNKKEDLGISQVSFKPEE